MEQGKSTKKFKFPKFHMIKLTKKKIIIVLIICIIGAGGYWGYNKFFGSKDTTTVNTATVTKGDITVSIEGTGVIAPIEQYNITSLATGDILKSDFEEGQKVNKGDLLYVIDTKNIDSNIEKAKVALEKQKMSNGQTAQSYANLSVTTPISGVVTNVYVKKGDSVQNGTKIADVINDDYMMLEVPFNSSDAANIYVGATAKVTLENSFFETTGTVQSVSSGEIVTSSGATISTVKIKVKNPGSITTSDKATAIINNMACNSSGTFNYLDQKTVTAKTSGDVASVNCNVGDNVSSGSVIVKLESSDAEVQLKLSELSLTDSELSLQNTQDQLDDYNITSPITGTVLQKTAKAGDTIDKSSSSSSSDSSNAMAVIADMSKLTFDIKVDELDISKIKIGQEVQVTADSLTGKTFKGTINKISQIGTSTDGVATYPVSVVMDYTDQIKVGMNVNAKIIVESKQNVLEIPASALNRGNKVLVKDEDGSRAASEKQNHSKNTTENGSNSTTPNASSSTSTYSSSKKSTTSSSKKTSTIGAVPAGFKYVTVEIGISNTDYVEITSGLKEGDIVVIPTVDTTTTTNKQTTTRTSGGMSGDGGGMPGGGMPGGGM